MAIFTVLKKTEIENLSEKFLGLPESPFTYEGVALGTVNTYYRLTFKNNRVYYLKIDEVGQERRLQNELDLLSFLAKKKLGYLTPSPLQLKNGGFYQPFHKKFALIFPEIKGQWIKPEKLSLLHLQKMGSALAKLNMHKPRTLSSHRFNQTGQRRVFLSIRKKLKNKHPELEKMISKKLQEFNLSRPRNESLTLIHADLFSENVLWINNKLSGILDFESAGLGSKLFDIGVALHALCWQQSFDLKKARAFLKGYEKIKKLSQSDWKNLAHHLDESAMRFLLTRLRDFDLVDTEVKAEPFKDFREFINRFEENKALVDAIRKK